MAVAAVCWDAEIRLDVLLMLADVWPCDDMTSDLGVCVDARSRG